MDSRLGVRSAFDPNMSHVGLGQAAELVSAAKLRHSALKRIGATDSDEVTLPTYETDEG